MAKQIGMLGALCLILTSCSMLRKTSKQELNSGYYKQTVDNRKQKVFIDIESDTIRIYPTSPEGKVLIRDTINGHHIFPKEMKTAFTQTIAFSNPSFDVDFLTIPLKYRPPQEDVPGQLNANLNGALYLGYRLDKYVINYKASPWGKSDRNIDHFGFSFGAFMGLGNTFMSATNTSNILQQEYDGIVWCKGIAGILAVNNFSVGLALGFDYLLDKNKKNWIYQNKPWIGLAFGLNLN